MSATNQQSCPLAPFTLCLSLPSISHAHALCRLDLSLIKRTHTRTQVWGNYGMPGGCPVGCLCGQCICCSFMLRQKLAQTHGIDDGINAFLCPFCCACCNFTQIIMTAKREGNIDSPVGEGAAGAPEDSVMVR